MDRTSLLDLSPITTGRLAIRPLLPDDAPALRALSDDPAILAAIPFLARPFTAEAALALIAGAEAGSDRFLGVWAGPDDLAGVVGVHLRDAGQIEIGYWYGPRFWGRGYATEAAGAVIARLRSMFRDRRIVAECRPENRASWRVLENLGFSATGTAGTRPGRSLLELKS